MSEQLTLPTLSCEPEQLGWSPLSAKPALQASAQLPPAARVAPSAQAASSAPFAGAPTPVTTHWQLAPGARVAVADARLRIEEFEAAYGDILSGEERENVETLGGLVFYLASRVPTRGELIRHSSGIEFEILEADPRRIHRLRIRRLPPRLAVEEAAE